MWKLAVLLAATAAVLGSVTTAGIAPTQPTQFGPSIEYAGGTGRSGAQAIDVRDLDLDGFPDVVVANNEDESVTLYYGRGGGSVEPPQELVVDPEGLFFPAAVRVADIDGDRLPDLVVTDDLNDAVVVMRQRPETRAFDRVIVGYSAEEPVGLAVADIDADGAPDIVTANASADPEAALTVFFQSGSRRGEFLAGLNLASTTPEAGFGGAVAVLASDLDGDGSVDLAAANVGADSVGILYGRGAGTFDPPVELAVGPGPVALAIADFDIDGTRDLVVADNSYTSVSLLLGAGRRSFQPVRLFELPGFPEAISVWDFNVDGRPDVAAVSATSETESALFVLRGDGKGDFLGACQGAENPDAPCSLASRNTTCGTGTCLPDTFRVGGTLPGAIASGDLSGDRIRDVAVANDGSAEAALSVLVNAAQLMRGDGDGDGSLGIADVDGAVFELFDGDGWTVITVGGGGRASSPAVDGNGDERVTAADIVAIIDALREA